MPDRLKDLDTELGQLNAKVDTLMTAADAERYNALQKHFNDLWLKFESFKEVKVCAIAAESLERQITVATTGLAEQFPRMPG